MKIAKASTYTFAMIAILVIAVTSMATASASDYAQVWGQKYESSGTSGTDDYATTNHPSISAPNWAAAPNAITDLSTRFIESGPTKACDIDCGLHPYASWGVNGVPGQFVDTSVTLAADGLYQYKAWLTTTNNVWEAQFCDGNGCHVLKDVNMGTNNSLPYVVAGGESNHQSVPIGSTTSRYHQVLTGSWNYWCYTSTHNNTSTGTITNNCGSPLYEWTVSY
ncbi:MAG: hypothetical protein HY682_09420 [Chloroflexi bacterium]|nr:hypothetical protein [Chloroflexota bacterium]